MRTSRPDSLKASSLLQESHGFRHGKVVTPEAAIIQASGEIESVPGHLVTTLALFLIKQGGNFLAESVENLDRDLSRLWHGVANGRNWIERIGIVAVQRELLGHGSGLDEERRVSRRCSMGIRR